MEILCFVFINLWSSRDILQRPAVLWGLSSWQKRQLLGGQARAHFLPYRPVETFPSQRDFHSFRAACRHCSLIKCSTLGRLSLELPPDLLFEDWVEINSWLGEEKQIDNEHLGWRGLRNQRLEAQKSKGPFLPVFPRQSPANQHNHHNSHMGLQEPYFPWLSKLKHLFGFTQAHISNSFPAAFLVVEWLTSLSVELWLWHSWVSRHLVQLSTPNRDSLWPTEGLCQSLNLSGDEDPTTP